MRKLSMLLAAALLAGSFSTSLAQSNGYIGVYADLAATQCCITQTAAPFSFYIYAVLGGATGGGLTGAEFRVETPGKTGYFFVKTVTPAANIDLGDPLDDPATDLDAGGCNIAFPTCQGTAPGDKILLYTYQAIPVSGTGLDLTVKSRTIPNNIFFQCALLTICDPPEYTKICLTPTNDSLGEDAILFRSYVRTNPANCPTNGVTCGPVAVASQTWSAMKELYR